MSATTIPGGTELDTTAVTKPSDRRPARIALFIRSVRSVGGAERVFVNLARGLADRGHAVDLLLEDSEGHLLHDLPDSVSVVLLKGGIRGRVRDVPYYAASLMRNLVPALRPGRARLPGFLLAFVRFLYKKRPRIAALRRYMARHRPDAILAFLYDPCLSLLLAAQLGAGRTSILVSIHNNITQQVGNAKTHTMREVPVLMQSFYPLADRIVAVSEGVRNDAAQWTGLPDGCFETIYNPIYRPELLALAEERCDHAWFGQYAGLPVVVAAGSLTPQKDFAMLLRAFALVAKERPARLVILGEGGGRDDLTALAVELGVAEHFDLPGHVINPHKYFARASVFVLSSAWEGLPTVLIEAMACGCPVVSTDCPSGPAEILENGRFGRLVPVGDARAMAAAIKAAMDDPPSRDSLRARAGTFSQEAAVAAYEALMLRPKAQLPGPE